MEEQNFHLANSHSLRRPVEILLKDGRQIRGFIVGYFKEDMDDAHSPILKWHIVEKPYGISFGIDPFGYLLGSIILQKDIVHIKCIDSI
ncbi:MAG: hypothetical protein IPK62_02370 [Bacteroidetes bacterium]|nr:hypothetical protein [Bacteroidota bacterium]MBK8143914.1 hypothetical protein [Bacteroidota bacterium]MBP6313998.1 hypothetical protein [Chitinophagaceae bacterium]